MDIDVGNVPALLVSLGGASLFAWVLYRRTTPTLALRLRLMLGALRWFAAFIVLALMAGPDLRVSQTRSAEPLVAVLIDDSRSMAYPAPEEKIARVRADFAGGFAERLAEKARTRLFAFSDAAREVSPDEAKHVEARGPRTDLVRGMKHVFDEVGLRPSAFVVLTDGGFNFGEDPVDYSSSLRIPVYVVSTAGEDKTPDVWIDRVEASGVAYAGSELPVVLHVAGRGPDVETSLSISDTTGEVLSTGVSISPGGATQTVGATIMAGNVGLHAFTARLAAFDGEAVTANNTINFSVDVIKGKTAICLVAPYPSWDFAFAKRSLEADPNIDVSVLFTGARARTTRVENSAGDLRQALTRSDVAVVFKGAVAGSDAEAVKRFVGEGGGLLLVSADRSSEALGDMNPFVVSTPGPQADALYSPMLTETGRGHEIMSAGGTDDFSVWPTLPPLPIDRSVRAASPSALVLLAGASADGSLPVCVVAKYGQGRVVGLAPYDIWRWDMVPKGVGIGVSPFAELIKNSTRWLGKSEDVELLSIATAKYDYLAGEPINVAARVADSNLKPLASASVHAEIVDRYSGGVVMRLDLAERGPGSHTAQADGLGPGSYELVATATYQGGVHGAARARFRVGDRSLEDSRFDGDRTQLADLAEATGGGYYEAGRAEALAEDLSLGRVITKSFKQLKISLGIATFVVLVALLGAEWLIRRRRMLA